MSSFPFVKASGFYGFARLARRCIPQPYGCAFAPWDETQHSHRAIDTLNSGNRNLE